ncbi:MAG: hypothetical protein AAGB12_16760 [Pseudomonadota bacterium]
MEHNFDEKSLMARLDLESSNLLFDELEERERYIDLSLDQSAIQN